MKKLMIVDDEQAVRQGLKAIVDWKELGYEICAEASDGEEGLLKVLEYRPDLVLVDIKMPVYNGIELIEKARANQFTGRFIILSGYSDFDYARKAIKFGVNSYLLKPLDEDELLNEVKAINSAIEDESIHYLYSRQSYHEVKNQFLLDLLENKIDVRNESEYISNLSVHSDYYQLILICDVSSQNKEKIVKTIPLAFKSKLEVLCKTDSIILLVMDAPIVDELIQLYNSKKDSTDIVVVGRPFHKVVDMHASYIRLLNLSKRTFYLDFSRVVLEAEIDYGPPICPYINEEAMVDVLCQAIQAETNSSIEELTKEIKIYCEQADMSKGKMIEWVTDILFKVMNLVRDNYSFINEIPSNQEIMNQLYVYTHFHAVHAYLLNLLKSIRKRIASLDHRDMIQRICGHINVHYTEQITLAMLAKRYGYHHAYLGKAFKKVTGMSFNRYVDIRRIEAAKQLLQGKEKLKISSIASAVGIRDYEYFCKKFKAYSGMTPKEYRNQYEER